MTTAEQQLRKAGFCRSPNNIEGRPGSEWYAAGPGIKTVKWPERIICNTTGSIEIIQGYFSNVVVNKYFLCALDFIDWLNWHGIISEGGQSANVWD